MAHPAASASPVHAAGMNQGNEAASRASAEVPADAADAVCATRMQARYRARRAWPGLWHPMRVRACLEPARLGTGRAWTETWRLAPERSGRPRSRDGRLRPWNRRGRSRPWHRCVRSCSHRMRPRASPSVAASRYRPTPAGPRDAFRCKAMLPFNLPSWATAVPGGQREGEPRMKSSNGISRILKARWCAPSTGTGRQAADCRLVGVDLAHEWAGRPHRGRFAGFVSTSRPCVSHRGSIDGEIA